MDLVHGSAGCALLRHRDGAHAHSTSFFFYLFTYFWNFWNFFIFFTSYFYFIFIFPQTRRRRREVILRLVAAALGKCQGEVELYNPKAPDLSRSRTGTRTRGFEGWMDAPGNA
jgi:hypothetical protein